MTVRGKESVLAHEFTTDCERAHAEDGATSAPVQAVASAQLRSAEARWAGTLQGYVRPVEQRAVQLACAVVLQDTPAAPHADRPVEQGAATLMDAALPVSGGRGVFADACRAQAGVYAAQPVPAATPVLADPRRAFFRERALNAYMRGADLASVIRVASPSTWRVLAAVGSLVLCSLVVLTLGHVDVTCKGPGVLRVTGGVREVQANVGGIVQAVHVRSGQAVQRGDVLLVLDLNIARAAVEEAEKKLAFVQRELDALLRRSQQTAHRTEGLLRREARLVTERLSAQQSSTERLRVQLVSMRDLHQRGLVATSTSDELEERVHAGVRAQLALNEELLHVEARLHGLVLDEDKQRYHWISEQESARAGLEAARAALRDATVTAPVAGVVEAVVVQPGELLRPGMLVGKLLPRGVPTQVVAFVRERDRAFAKPGDRTRLEVMQLPAAEFGVVAAKVARISDDLASAEEVAEALGASAKLEEAHYRVELELVPDANAALREKLRAGMLIDAKFVLRRRLLLALLFDPIRRWSE